jgi:hypothetical protein
MVDRGRGDAENILGVIVHRDVERDVANECTFSIM